MMVLTVTALLVLVCAIAHVSIGAYVLSINPRSAAHRAFFYVVMPIAMWASAWPACGVSIRLFCVCYLRPLLKLSEGYRTTQSPNRISSNRDGGASCADSHNERPGAI